MPFGGGVSGEVKLHFNPFGGFTATAIISRFRAG